MSQHATELCLLLVNDTYGELASQAFSALICYGRLTFEMLLHYTELSRRQIKHSLATLVQQHLALWYSSPDNDVTYYEANWTSAYALVRSAKIVKIVEDRYGSLAGGVVSNMLLSGHARVADLAQSYIVSPPPDSGVSQAKSMETIINHPAIGSPKGQDGSQGTSPESFDSTLRALLDAGFLSIVHESHFRSDTDNQNEAEALLRCSGQFHGELRGEKKLEFAGAVEQKLLDWRFGTNSRIKAASAKIIEKPLHSMKRKFKEESTTLNGTGKRRRPDHDHDHESVDDITSPSLRAVTRSEVSDEYQDVLKVNYEKLMVAARNESLVEIVEQRIGKTASEVYREVLRNIETELECCNLHPEINDVSYNDSTEEDPGISTAEAGVAMSELDSLECGIGLADPNMVNLNTIIHPKRRRRKQDAEETNEDCNTSTSEGDISGDEQHNGNISGVDENHDEIDGDADYWSEVKVGKNGERTHKPSITTLSVSTPQTTASLTRQNLFLLAEHPYKFVTYIRRRHDKPERWTVNFQALARQMRLIELENTIVSRYGTEALRIVRILQDKGKLDEKAIAQFALMNQKTMRSILTTMHEAGHLELQEVPRDNQRAPSKTMFLWFFDPERCRQKVLEETYKTMARCLQRAKGEREAIQGVIDKASRTDVVGNEDEFLSIDEKTTLTSWREKEENLLGAVGRLDDLVAVLRDY